MNDNSELSGHFVSFHLLWEKDSSNTTELEMFYSVDAIAENKDILQWMDLPAPNLPLIIHVSLSLLFEALVWLDSSKIRE